MAISVNGTSLVYHYLQPHLPANTPYDNWPRCLGCRFVTGQLKGSALQKALDTLPVKQCAYKQILQLNLWKD